MAACAKTGRLWRRLRVGGFVCMSALWLPAALALSHERLDQLHHTAWTAEDGAPPEIRAMAQTRDGWLWLGSTAGLYRFDGRRFERIDVNPPGVVRSASVATLAALPGGELWIGYVYGGASRLKDGRFTHYQQDSGLPLGPTLRHFEFDGSQRLWAWTSRSAFVFDGRQFVVPPPALQPPSGASAVQTDAQGDSWFLGAEVMHRLRKGADHIERTTIAVKEEDALVLAADGSVWHLREHTMQRLSEGPAVPGWQPVSFSPEPFLLDRDWNLWSNYCDGACRRRVQGPVTAGARELRHDPQQLFTRADGLSGKLPMSVLEDREGNIWFGGKRGLDRFRHAPIVRVPTGDTLYFAMAPAAGRGIWLGTTFNTLPDQPYQRAEGSTVTDLAAPRLRVTSQFRDADGTVWVGGRAALWRQRDGQLTPVPVPPDGPARRVVQALARDAGGGLWMSMQGDGVYRLHDGQWTPKGGHATLPDSSANVIVAGDDGALWLAYSNHGVFRVKDGQVRRWHTDEGLLSGPVTALHARGGTVLAAGALGLFVLDGEQRFRRVLSEGRDVLQGITGIVVTRNGELWLNGLAGLVRVAPDAARQAFATTGAPLRHTLLDAADGLPGVAQQVRPLPTLVEADDGRLWIAASEGLAWIDPAQRQRNPHAPTVHIHSLRSDAGVQADPQHTLLPPDPGNVSIAYTALTLGHAERARFRYRLEGFDSAWRDAGTEREAHYTRLPPGDYRFRVLAANEDGVWNEAGAVLPLRVQPAFHQTLWFRALVVAALLGLLWLAYRWRLRQLAARLQLRSEARLQERERIARDLHDTLLQSTQGLILKFQGIAEQTRSDPTLRARMERALAQADAVLHEGRDRVAGLRAAVDGASGDLLAQIMAQQLAVDSPSAPALQAHTSGPARPLLAQAHEEIVAIGREAVLNARRHAGATRIDLRLLHTDDALHMQVRDDGRGIQSDVLDTGAPPGHWGLLGMHERAARLGGRLTVQRHPDGGTEVELRVPAERAYPVVAPTRRWARRLRRRSRSPA